jgi:hypothetical protein
MSVSHLILILEKLERLESCQIVPKSEMKKRTLAGRCWEKDALNRMGFELKISEHEQTTDCSPIIDRMNLVPNDPMASNHNPS